jgi:hypothetical protein
LAAWWAGKKFPDARNVVSLWRILVGAPLFLIWASLLAITAVCLGATVWLAAYLVLTWLGLKLYYRVKKLAVAAHNGLRHPLLREQVLAFRENVLASIPDEID